MTSPPKQPSVDIGIPVYRRPQFVAEAIESVIAQTFEQWRLVVLEDGTGSDSIAAAVEPYLADERISFLSTGQHVGAALSMTRLIERGSAPYMALLHDDDVWGPNFLAHRLEFLDRHLACSFVFSPVTVIDARGTHVERWRATVDEGLHTPADFVPRLLRTNVIPSPSVVVRRSAYEAVGARFDTRLRRIYDHEMWVRLALNGPVGFVRSHDVYWRVHDEQSSRSLSDRIQDFSAFLEITDELVSERLPQARLSRRERRRALSGWLLTNALDAVEQGELQVARRSLRKALGGYPLSLLDPRTPMTAAGLVLGNPARISVRRIRSTVRRHGIRAHLRAR